MDVANWCIPITLQYLHVKGHQDNDPQHPLTIIERNNVEYNKHVKVYICNHPLCSTTLATPEFPVAQLHLKINGKVICQQFLQAI